jgi:hypothetical protein
MSDASAGLESEVSYDTPGRLLTAKKNLRDTFVTLTSWYYDAPKESQSNSKHPLFYLTDRMRNYHIDPRVNLDKLDISNEGLVSDIKAYTDLVRKQRVAERQMHDPNQSELVKQKAQNDYASASSGIMTLLEKSEQLRKHLQINGPAEIYPQERELEKIAANCYTHLATFTSIVGGDLEGIDSNEVIGILSVLSGAKSGTETHALAVERILTNQDDNIYGAIGFFANLHDRSIREKITQALIKIKSASKSAIEKYFAQLNTLVRHDLIADGKVFDNLLGEVASAVNKPGFSHKDHANSLWDAFRQAHDRMSRMYSHAYAGDSDYAAMPDFMTQLEDLSRELGDIFVSKVNGYYEEIVLEQGQNTASQTIYNEIYKRFVQDWNDHIKSNHNGLSPNSVLSIRALDKAIEITRTRLKDISDVMY